MSQRLLRLQDFTFQLLLCGGDEFECLIVENEFFSSLPSPPGEDFEAGNADSPAQERRGRVVLLAFLNGDQRDGLENVLCVVEVRDEAGDVCRNGRLCRRPQRHHIFLAALRQHTTPLRPVPGKLPL